jgi:hypothetical protein
MNGVWENEKGKHRVYFSNQLCFTNLVNKVKVYAKRIFYLKVNFPEFFLFPNYKILYLRVNEKIFGHSFIK